MKKRKLRFGQRWRPNRGPWRTISAMKMDETEIHWRDINGLHWCYDEDFQNWIQGTNAKLVKRRGK